MADGPGKMTATQRKAFETLVKGAAEGRHAECEAVIRAAGWVRRDDGMSEGDLVGALPKVSRAALAEWRAQGLKAELSGSKRLYKPLEVLAWVVGRFVHRARKREAEPAEEVVGTQREIADRLGVNERSVRNWVKEGMPVRADRTYDITAIKAWREDKGLGGGPADLRRKQMLAEIEFRETMTRLKQYDVAVRSGHLITRGHVESRRAAQIVNAKGVLTRLPAKLAEQLVGQERVTIERMLKEEVAEAIEAIRESPLTVGTALGGVLEEFLRLVREAVPAPATAAELVALWEEACEGGGDLRLPISDLRLKTGGKGEA